MIVKECQLPKRNRKADKLLLSAHQHCPKRMRRFFGSVELDPKRAGRDAGSIAEVLKKNK